MKVHCDHLDTAFLDARPLVWEVMDDAALFAAGAWEAAWDAAWEDLFNCWCGCPL